MTAQSKMNAVNHPRLCLHPRCCWLGVQCTWYSICLCLHKACGRHWPRCNDLHTHTQKGRVLLKPTLSTAVILHRRASSCPSVERDGGVCVCVCVCDSLPTCWSWLMSVLTHSAESHPPRWVYNGWINSCPPTALCSPCVLLYNGWINSCPPTSLCSPCVLLYPTRHCSPCVLLNLNSKGFHVELFTKINKFAVTEPRNFSVSVYIKSDESQIL